MGLRPINWAEIDMQYYKSNILDDYSLSFVSEDFIKSNDRYLVIGINIDLDLKYDCIVLYVGLAKDIKVEENIVIVPIPDYLPPGGKSNYISIYTLKDGVSAESVAICLGKELNSPKPWFDPAGSSTDLQWSY